VTVPTLLLARRSPLLMSGVVLFALWCATFVGWWQLAPRLWFFVHRPVFEVARVVVDPGTDYYGAALPFPLRFLSETGTVSSVVMSEGSEAGAFFPQGVGIPDDAGGYLYSTTSPVGADLYGSLCTRPQGLVDVQAHRPLSTATSRAVLSRAGSSGGSACVLRTTVGLRRRSGARRTDGSRDLLEQRLAALCLRYSTQARPDSTSSHSPTTYLRNRFEGLQGPHSVRLIR
jgi:hypothetical protein